MIKTIVGEMENGDKMRVLLWRAGSFGRKSPSDHLLVAMIKALCYEGHTVHILQQGTVGTEAVLPDELQGLGITTEAAPFRQQEKQNFIGRYIAAMLFVLSCWKYIRKKDCYDAVYLHSTNVAGAALLVLRIKLGKKVPVTYGVQDIFPYNAVYSGHLSKNGIPFRILAAIQRYAYREADRIATISEDMRDLLVEDGVTPEKIECIYNWSYRDAPYVAEEMDCSVAQGMFPKTHFNVVYAGNIGIMQNVDIVVSTAKLMQDENDILFHIVGDGAYKEKLQKEAEGMENVRFHPMQSSELAPSLYITADVNVIPLVKGVYRTALPSKTATCLACGKPIIMAIGKESRFGKAVEETGACVVTESDSPKEMRDALLQIKAAKLGRSGTTFFEENLSITRNSRRYAEVITSQRASANKLAL